MSTEEKEAAKAAKEAEKEAAKAETADFIVRNPEEFKPRVLPLIVEPNGGIKEDHKFLGWASKAQMRLAGVINGYAYKNQKKWNEKKDDKTVNGTLIKGLLTRLKEAADAPDPVEGPLSFKDKTMQQ